ncbi:hypothetical protein [Chryseosolibacter indicus]|uniref:Uncharacterized protein n=1 Tax=Chryseosolibacter indicus TaxID=2782351 RepID=A0ABS5VKF5_9BACT|nr:hypothetical protein [Chryseosolibacter indicus]MBT1701925.1 hypothetical protein [Chryseosolibacter indicus]
MKKLIIAPGLAALVFVLIGADIPKNESAQNASNASVVKKKCVGYTIIEFGKGVDCNGDTVKLVKVNNGGQVLAQ